MKKIEHIFPWKGAHTKHRLVVHMVFVTKYRKRVIQGRIELRIRQLFFECCEVNNWFIHDMETVRDHVHIVIQTNPQNSIAEVAQRLKGGSSIVLRREFPELQEFLWGNSFWADGYYSETIGKTSEEFVREYVKNQKN